MKVGIIDADLIGKKKHRFPNLACMKLSAYYKDEGDSVELLLEYSNLSQFDKIFISKVFTDTKIPDYVLTLDNVAYGGTGFYYDKAPKLPYDVEHHFPDYSLYSEFVEAQIASGLKRKGFEYYLDYSIGFMTRGCFRKCPFCVNQNYDKVSQASALFEFYDPSRKYICLLDDNVFGFSAWKSVFEALQSTGKPFQFKQGMDERLLTEEKCRVLTESKYKGDYIFAFDDIEDSELIKDRLSLLRQYTTKQCRFYVFCGFDRDDVWDTDFWEHDISDLFKRIQILMNYGCIPYVMRYYRYKESPYKGMYTTIARWCNQPSFFKKKSFREFVEANRELNSLAPIRYAENFEREHENMSRMYYDLKFEDLKGDA